MSHTRARTSGIVIHGSRIYDFAFGRLIRTGDRELLARAGVGPGDHLLDVGTGPGYLALAASRLVAPGGAAIGIDASPEMIARARTLAARARSVAEYVVAAAESLPFDADAFDVVVSRLVFHHLPGGLKEQALGEIARVLKPGGRLLIADLAAPAAVGAHHFVAHLLRHHPAGGASLAELVSGAGFTQLTCGTLMHGMLAGVAARNPQHGAKG